MAEAMLLPSPFAAKAWPEADVAFLVESLRVWGPDLPILAAKQRDVLKRLPRRCGLCKTLLQRSCALLTGKSRLRRTLLSLPSLRLC